VSFIAIFKAKVDHDPQGQGQDNNNNNNDRLTAFDPGQPG